MTKLSKFVSQPLLLVTVTVLHVPDQLVTSVVSVCAASVNVRVCWPAQPSVIVLEPLPPLYASTWTNLRGETNPNPWLFTPAPLKLTLFVVNAPNGPERYQPLVPQSMTPVGYWPLNARFGLDRLSKFTVCLGAGVGVAVGVAVLPLAMLRLSKFVSQPLLLPTVSVEHVPLQPV